MYKIYKNMTISRGQTPRQLYGLGSFVKSITKPIKKVVNVAKDVVKSDLGKAAILGASVFGIPGTSFTGFRTLSPIRNFITGGTLSPNLMDEVALTGKQNIFKKALSKIPGGGVTAAIFGASALGGALTPEAQADVEALRQSDDPEALAGYLRRYYRNLNPDADPETVESFVRANKAEGGRMQYAYGSSEENAVQASGIMGLPLNENPAGVTELDLRETGGFIPPVGVKEKADDIPAMLSNNEFVFTADAVRGMGDGDVNVGAQRMYDMMKKLENGGRV